MIHRRPFFVRPLAAHAEGHLEVTTIVVVVIDRYIYTTTTTLMVTLK